MSGSDDSRNITRAVLAREAARKGIHLTSCAVPALLSIGIAREIVAAVLAALFAIAIVVEVARHRSAAIASRFTRLFAPLLRDRELTHVTGATWMLGALFAAVVFLRRDAAIAATWAVAVGDASAALIGIRFGRRRGATSTKTFEGSAACAIVSAIGALLLARMSVGEAATLGIIAALAERAPGSIDDNARIVTLVGGAAWLWSVASY